MINQYESKKINNYILNLFLAFLTFTILFGRSFTGVYLFNFRIGELMIGFCLVVSLVLLLLPYENKIIKFDKFQFYVHKILLVQFVLVVFLTNTSIFNVYTYRSSSYIWTFVFLYVSLFLTKNLSKESWFLKATPLFLPGLYILSTIKYPEFLVNFFQNYSDKFDFVKASDLLVVFIASNFLLRKRYKNSMSDFIYFIISSAVYLPYLLFKSKGAFLPAILFILFNFFFYIKIIRNEKIKSFLIILVSVPIFLASTFHIYGNLNFTKQGMDNYEQIESIVSSDQIRDNLSSLINEKNTGEIFYSFYIMDGRLYSQEQMADWRLQIWQDIYRDLFYESEYFEDDNYKLVRIEKERRNDIFYKGFGYNELLPAMNHWERQGTDGTNENPHNFLIYSLGRGGIFQPILIILFHISIFSYWYRKYKNFDILLYQLPIVMTSLFDASMESVRFPFIFYSYLGIILNEKF